MAEPYDIAVLAGDGIGPEITPPCLEVMVAAVGGTDRLRFHPLPAGAGLYRDSGESLPDTTMAVAADADAILLAAMGLPEVRYPDGREIAPQLDLRERLDLYAGMRPIRSIPGVPGPLSDRRGGELDFLLVRESTEGLFAGRGRTLYDAARHRAYDTMTITREASERLFRAAFVEARRRRARGVGRGRVTCVDKANVLGGFAFFRDIFHEVAAEFDDVEADTCYVDAMALNLVRAPWAYDVVVTENMFGDILSDLGASLIGGMGVAPSADVGVANAVFQPSHGTAPDIAGTGRANPTAMFLSGALLLRWLGETRDDTALVVAADRLVSAIDHAFAGGMLRSTEQGGDDGVVEITTAVLGALETVDAVDA
ncbi:MAG: isocitrate/isopropylmalate family dehydrogenase [Actinomycetota bacterium]